MNETTVIRIYTNNPDVAKLKKEYPNAKVISVSEKSAFVIQGDWTDAEVQASVDYQLAIEKGEREWKEAREARNNKLVEVSSSSTTRTLRQAHSRRPRPASSTWIS